MGFVFQVKGCTLGVKSKHTVNAYTLFNSSVHPPSWCNGDGNFQGGDLTPVTVIFRVTKLGKTQHKKFTHTKRITLFITLGDIPSPMYTNLYY